MKKIIPLKNESDKFLPKHKMDGDDTPKKKESYREIMLSHKAKK